MTADDNCYGGSQAPWPMHKQVVVAVLLLGGTACLGAVVVVSGGSGYALSIDGTTDIPEQTVTIDGSEFTFDALAVRERGEELAVQASIPPEADDYNVDLRNSDNEPVQSRPMTGSGETTLNTSRDPGTYVVILRDDGIRVIHPLVIAGFDVTTFDIPDEIERGSTETATIEFADRESMGEPYAVEVVIGNGDSSELLRTTAELVSENDDSYTYEAKINGDDLDGGAYSAYAVAQTDQELEGGEKEIVGISGQRSVAFTAQNDGSGGAGTGDESTTDDGGEAPATPTPTPDGTGETATPTPGESASTAEPGETPTPAEDGDDVITPGGGDDADDDTDAGSDGDGAAPPVAVLVAFLALVGLWWRRRHR